MINRLIVLILPILFIVGCRQQIEYNIVCDGNSLTAGQGSSISYPQLMEQYLKKTTSCKVTNIGVGAQTTLDMLNDEIQQLESYYDPLAKNVLFAWEIRNHLVINCPDINTAKLNFVEYCKKANEIGYKVYVLTLLPSYTSKYCGDTTELAYDKLEQDRLLVNDWLRNEYKTFANGIVDVAKDSLIGQTGQNHELEYKFSSSTRPIQTDYYFDGTHLTQKGYSIVAEDCITRILKNKTPNNVYEK
jgi:lysophospholipase L1-like esterase